MLLDLVKPYRFVGFEPFGFSPGSIATASWRAHDGVRKDDKLIVSQYGVEQWSRRWRWQESLPSPSNDPFAHG